jgi:putative transposase
VPYAEFFFEEALPRMERVLKVAILRRGLPQALYVDNGQVYSATQFGAACATLGIRRIHTAPYSPESKGYAAYCTSFARSAGNSANRRRLASLRP